MSGIPIITADQRQAEKKGIKGVIFGKSGIGKTSLLWTLPEATTLFFDVEAGDLAVEGWTGDSFRPRTWQECRDLQSLLVDPIPRFAMTKCIAKLTLTRCAKNTAMHQCLIATTRCLSIP